VILPSTFTTERLILRPFELRDAQAVQHFASDFEIAKTTLSIPHPYPDGAAEAWIESLAPLAEKGRSYTFAITLRESGELIGCIGLNVHPEHARGEIAYWIGRPHWGRGYVTEAAREIVAFGFHELQLNRIYALAFTSNPGSYRVMEKIGMKYEGTLVGHVRKWESFMDLVSYGMTRTDHQGA
jgi:[ribosomal protein S5]-alanine N-acetyltransferase